MLDAGTLRNLSRSYAPLASLPGPLAARLEREARRLRAAGDAELLTEGSECPGLMLPISGGLRISKALPEARELLLYRVAPGEACVLSLACLLGEDPFPARAVTEGALDAVLLPRPLFGDLVDASPAFRRLVFRSFARRLSELMQLVEAVGFHRLDRRLARLLVARESPLRATHREIADELGSVREIVSRLLKGFEERGLVRLGRGEITIVARQELSRLAADPERDPGH